MLHCVQIRGIFALSFGKTLADCEINSGTSDTLKTQLGLIGS